MNRFDCTNNVLMSTPTGEEKIDSVHEMPLKELNPKFLKSLNYLKKKLFDEPKPRVKKLTF